MVPTPKVLLKDFFIFACIFAREITRMESCVSRACVSGKIKLSTVVPLTLLTLPI